MDMTTPEQIAEARAVGAGLVSHLDAHIELARGALRNPHLSMTDRVQIILAVRIWEAEREQVARSLDVVNAHSAMVS